MLQVKLRLNNKLAKYDIFRVCQAKDEPIKDWVKLAVKTERKLLLHRRFFGLMKNRAHGQRNYCKVNKYLPEHDTTGLEIKILKPVDAMKYTLERVRKGFQLQVMCFVII